MHSTAVTLSPDHAQAVNHRTLRNRAYAFIEHYPDIHAMAYRAARKILVKHTGHSSLAPSHVYWHRFATAAGSPRTFTGYRHSGPPIESLSLIELVMQRFSAADQDSPDDLNLYGGFYSVGADQDDYDESNEVPMLPSEVLQDFWKIDFASECKKSVAVFWRDHGEDFCTFAMIRTLSAAGLALSRQHLRPNDFQTVVRAVTGAADPHIDWSTLTQPRPFAAGLSLQVLKLAGLKARDMLCISDAHGRQIVYRPDDQPAFLCFDDVSALNQWVQAQLADPAKRYAFAAHFTRDRKHQTAFATKLARSGEHAWRAPSLSPQAREEGARSVFRQFRDRAHQEMNEDIHQQLTSNGSLRKQMWIGYLSAFIHLGGAFVPLGWPVALTLIGAGLANIGLNIDQAVSGRTPQLRKAGVAGAVANSIYLFLNLPFLADLKGPVAQVAQPPLDDASVEALAEHVVPGDAPPVPEIHVAPGVQVRSNGEAWITMSGESYRVRYLKDLNLWTTVDPLNPFSFRGARLVRYNDEGEWEVVAQPGLRGGMDAQGPAVASASQPFQTVSSAFWDTHMQLNLTEEQRLSTLGEERQASVIDVYEQQPADALVSDANGEDTVIDSAGNSHRVFKSSDGWSGGSIGLYTHDDDLFNVFLRTGSHHRRGQIAAVEQLVEDLDEVGYNNDVALYRGGSGGRGTSGKVFREGKFKVGDVLVNTDVTSFSENPYVARVFASSQGGASSDGFAGPITFDDTSVVFELPAKQYLNATPISPFSHTADEAESVFLPGNYFRIEHLEEVAGSQYKFMHVRLKQIPAEQVAGPAYDLRTGVVFKRHEYATRLGPGAERLMNRFFPVPASSSSPH